MTIHKEAFVCLKADGYIHPDHESRESVLRRYYYAIVSLLKVRARLAETCPDVAAGRAREALVIREGEFTVDHRPMSLRILLAQCRCCPDLEPLEPIMHPAPGIAEAVHEASLTALGKLRWYQDNDGGLAAVFREYDEALAPVLDVAREDVARATGTEAAPSAEMAEFEKLLASSCELDAADQARATAEMTFSVLRSSFRDLLQRGDQQAAVDRIASMPVGLANHLRPALVRLAHVLEAADRQRAEADRWNGEGVPS
ncbi:hypothetical protein AB0M39_38110 [Streptomyces sp. NPDC051907]|uniref:hypothetical protein n=1 Tax=Streptomyces sp. NPDC051907 TaxID=3155284 RepID=UPI003435E8F1